MTKSPEAIATSSQISMELAAQNAGTPGPEHPNCVKCGLHTTCNSPFMAAEGEKTAEVLFVGKRPGQEEDKIGRPFVGESGKMLRGVVEDEFKLEAAYTNVVRCFPPPGKEPSTHQVAYCGPFLQQDVERFSDAGVIMPLGGLALKSLTGYTGIASWRGRPITQSNGVVMLPTYHPAAILYDKEREADWITDMGMMVNVIMKQVAPSADEHYRYELVDTVAKARDMFATIRQAERCAFDLEFRWLRAYKHNNLILMASFAVADVAWALPLYHKDSPFSEDEMLDVVDMLDEFASDISVGKLGHNIKIDHLVMLAMLGIDLVGVDGDTQLLSQVLDSRAGFHDLAQLASKHLNMHDYDAELEAYKAEHPEADYKKGGDYSQIPLDVLWLYAAKDAAAVYLLEPVLLAKCDNKQEAIYKQIVVPTSNVLAHMENNGNMVDLDLVAEYRRIYEEALVPLHEEMRADPDVVRLELWQNDATEDQVVFDEDGRIVGYTQEVKDSNKRRGWKWNAFNPRSSDQNRKIVYEYKGHKITVKTPTGKPSAKKDVLEWIRDDPWINTLQVYRLYSVSSLDKYLTKIPGWVDSDGRVRSDYRVVGTETGRTSSRNPNMQNIPAPEKEPGTLLDKYPIKNAFTHTWDGGCLYAVDYKAVELRVMACLSGAKRMVQMFEEGKDPHTYVAAQLNKIPESEVTKEIRYPAKWINWTMLFGGDWHTLVRLYKISKAEAQKLESGWYGIFPEVLDFYAESVEYARRHGYAVSPTGRRRYMPYIINSSHERMRKEEREAANHPIQSAASDLLMMSLIVVHDVIRAHSMRSVMVNTVHDSIVFDVYPGELEQVHEICSDVMCKLPDYAEEYCPDIDLSWVTVPLLVDAEVGTHYGSLEHYIEGVQ